MTFPSVHGSGGQAFTHKQERKDRREERKAARNNADIRPFVSIGEAAELVLLRIIKAQEGK